jgi:hypothetical protein
MNKIPLIIILLFIPTMIVHIVNIWHGNHGIGLKIIQTFLIFLVFIIFLIVGIRNLKK